MRGIQYGIAAAVMTAGVVGASTPMTNTHLQASALEQKIAVEEDKTYRLAGDIVGQEEIYPSNGEFVMPGDMKKCGFAERDGNLGYLVTLKPGKGERKESYLIVAKPDRISALKEALKEGKHATIDIVGFKNEYVLRKRPGSKIMTSDDVIYSRPIYDAGCQVTTYRFTPTDCVVKTW